MSWFYLEPAFSTSYHLGSWTWDMNLCGQGFAWHRLPPAVLAVAGPHIHSLDEGHGGEEQERHRSCEVHVEKC